MRYDCRWPRFFAPPSIDVVTARACVCLSSIQCRMSYMSLVRMRYAVWYKITFTARRVNVAHHERVDYWYQVNWTLCVQTRWRLNHATLPSLPVETSRISTQLEKKSAGWSLPCRLPHFWYNIIIIIIIITVIITITIPIGVDPWVDGGTCPPTFEVEGTPYVLSPLLFGSRHCLLFEELPILTEIPFIAAISTKISQLILRKIIKIVANRC